MTKIFNNYILNIYVLSLIVFLLTATVIGTTIESGLDPSYTFAFNYFFLHDIQIGKDIIFSFGPLSFLLWPQPQGNNLFIATIIIFILKYIFILLIYNLYFLIHSKKNYLTWFFLTIYIYVFASLTNVHNILIFIPLLLVFHYYMTKKIFWIIFASSMLAIALLVKASTGIIAFLPLLSFSVYSIFVKDYKIPIIIFFTLSSTFLLIWFSLYQNFLGIYDYLYGILELSKGNSTAMTLNPKNNWLIFLFFLFLILSFPLLKKEKHISFFYLISIVSLAAAFKYAVSREDHIFYFLEFLLQYILLIFLIIKNVKKEDIIYLLSAYFLFILFIFYTPYRNNMSNYFMTSLSSLSVNTFQAFNFQNREKNLKAISTNSLKPFILHPEDKKLIDKSTVDIYPWDTSYIAANNLNWKPRPTFQSYISYTSYLDQNNANYIKSQEASQYLIWQTKHWGGEISSIDGRYLLNDEPMTLYELLNHYDIVSRRDSYFILQRSKSKLTKKFIMKTEYTWNKWIDIPQNSNYTFLVANTYIERSILQKIKKLIYKEFQVYIYYKFQDNTEKRYRLVVDTAKNGLWIEPYLSELFKYKTFNRVKSIKLEHSKDDFFKEKFQIAWYGVLSSETFIDKINQNFVESVDNSTHITTNKGINISK